MQTIMKQFIVPFYQLQFTATGHGAIVLYVI